MSKPAAKEQSKTKAAKPSKTRRADQYNDPSYDYQRYWDNRQYEHLAEEIALTKLLKGRHFHRAVDVGGGYGRICVLLSKYADEVILVEPSQKQLDKAAKFLKDYPTVKRQLGQADGLPFDDDSVDLLTMVRVMHHLPDPSRELAEIARVLNPDGYAIIEVANYAHMRNRLKHVVRRQRLPVKPVDIRSETNRRAEEIPFVNHNPSTVVRQLEHAGLYVDGTLSVSNLRSVRLKKIMPREIMLGVERLLQRPLATIYFGPSIFLLVRKAQPA